MKQKRGITARLIRVILQAGLCGLLLFLLLVQGADSMITRCFSGSALQHAMTEHRAAQLKEYVRENGLSASDHRALQRWCDKQPLVLMELYRGSRLLFNSYYDEEDALSDRNIKGPHYDWCSYYEIPFADGTAELLICTDETYALRAVARLAGLSLAGLLFFAIVLHGMKGTVRYIYRLTDEIAVLGGGNLEHPFTVHGDDELARLAAGLEKMRRSLIAHRRNEAEMLRRNNEMITGLSHDLRTPLTKIMLCIELIQAGKYRSEEELSGYLAQICSSGLRLKGLSEHLLEYSLSGHSAQELQPRGLGFREAFFDLLSEMVDYAAGLGFRVETDIEWPAAEVEIIDPDVRRIFDNIMSNLEKYADREHPVSIACVREKGCIGFAFRNRKARTRTLEGHHVGLAVLESAMARMGGIYQVSDTAEDFGVTVLFRVIG